MREVPGNQAARQVPARPESEGRPQLLVPRLPPSGEQEYRQRHGERLNAASRREPIPERTCRPAANLSCRSGRTRTTAGRGAEQVHDARRGAGLVSNPCLSLPLNACAVGCENARLACRPPGTRDRGVMRSGTATQAPGQLARSAGRGRVKRPPPSELQYTPN